MTIIILAVTGRTQAEKSRLWIADIMVTVGSMKIDRIHGSCSFGYSFLTLRYLAKPALPVCCLLTLPCLDFPIVGIEFSPFPIHKVSFC